MWRRLGLAVVIGVMAGMATADAPDKSLRPMPRPTAVEATPPVVTNTGVVIATTVPSALVTVRPRIRPATLQGPILAEPVAEVVMATSSASGDILRNPKPVSVPRPAKRPEGLEQRQLASAAVVKVAPGKQAVVSKKGSVCGDPAIRGATMAPITSRVKGCGVPNPVKVTSVAGVQLSQAATMDCDTAKALKRWVEKGVVPAYGKGKVVELKVAGHYVCRTRNHRKGAKISEHGRGRAIDISGFTFSNGRTVTVARNFDRTMRKAHKAACGIFGTTLGPGSDGMHEDHLHFDTAKHRKGAYCR